MPHALSVYLSDSLFLVDAGNFHKGLNMLALTRRPGQVIVIGDGPTKIEIMIVHVTGDKVRVAVDAPRDVAVHRLEVYEKIRQGAETPPPQIDCCE